MKFLAKITLLLFLGSLCTPTIVCVLKKNADISSFYNFSEEEKSQKEITALISFDSVYAPIAITPSEQKLVVSKKFSVLDKISSEIFIPPQKIKLLL